nr:hypothetical protein GCM10020092_009910 [Actinoplanes digitatis]
MRPGDDRGGGPAGHRRGAVPLPGGDARADPDLGGEAAGDELVGGLPPPGLGQHGDRVGRGLQLLEHTAPMAVRTVVAA